MEENNQHSTSSKSRRRVGLLEDQPRNENLEPIKDSPVHSSGGSLLGKLKQNMEAPFSGSNVGESSSSPLGFKFLAARPISNEVVGPTLVTIMIIVSWNIIGLGRLEKRIEVRKLIRKHKIDNLLISESKIVKNIDKVIRDIWGSKSCRWEWV